MKPVPLPFAPQAKGIGGLDRAGFFKIALEHLGEIHHMGNLPGGQVDLQHLVLHGFPFRVGSQGQDGPFRAPIDIVVQFILAQAVHLGHLAEPVDPRNLPASHASDERTVVIP